MAANSDLAGILRDFDYKIQVIDAKIESKSRVIELLQNDLNPQSKADSESRLNAAMQELSDLTTNRELLVQSNLAAAKNHVDGPGN
ncbi:hypothetical protein QL285_017206 [Trifolium repens]|jgi:2-oxoglutarate dehydrogenase complex dehydrogenase (E1) component-like enzyme|nr:hypothetical protein QL285_017206 [Trifolium repens]